MTRGLRLRFLSFHGPSAEAAVVEFGPGLNVIYGASNTGKSFILNAVDFMLGGKPPLRDIPEREGYDRVLLAVETLAGDQFTVSRSVNGGAFTLFDGLHAAELPVDQGKILADIHNDKRDDNLSAYLLNLIDLTQKRIRKNKRGDTQSLSFRNLARLILINEQEIIQERSPLSDGNVVADTANTSVFKLLLTGVDDSAFTAGQKPTAEDQLRGGQIDLLDQLIGDYERQVNELAGKPDELQEQLARLENTMDSQSAQLAVTEAQFKEATVQRRDVAKRVEEANNRLTEITALLDRFTLLNAHYRSDLERLSAIEEAGSLFGALGDATCPLCGALKEHQAKADCEGDVDQVVAAAAAEIAKIKVRQTDLADTMTTLREEAVSFERRLPRLESRFRELSGEIDSVVAPNLRQLRASYKELADKGGEVREALAIHRGLSDLIERKAKLEKEDEARFGSANGSTDFGLSTATADKFASLIQTILQEWHFPNADRVHFDLSTRDLVIGGKNRIAFGKGLRAITQAAFTIGLMEYCRLNQTAHPGFVMLDSPLLSYREPEAGADDSDDLRGTDLNASFFDYIANLPEDRQIIIIENTDPPPQIRKSERTALFTGVLGKGRPGLFPEPKKGEFDDLLG
ncbi:MAG: hypothetical protein E7773_06790 [Sphingomonas sp.]|uniref:ATP-binding protein n=1 Tax=Sphingomonas sp. TaxID=28214 RepID=UPI00121E4A95|nr:ATP-binding protein [Sphingomonas sp.]THD36701.1 MAG: hypothetical protein E7773_06790 [Sphingomonas sp.]